MEGVKNLVVKKHNLPVTKIVDELMEVNLLLLFFSVRMHSDLQFVTFLIRVEKILENLICLVLRAEISFRSSTIIDIRKNIRQLVNP
jgi:hypothetical protein